MKITKLRTATAVIRAALQEAIEMKYGVALVPERPGWGFTFDMKAVEKYRF
jgi:L-alanine-DL-glutamate epimerase-like enolase superfamily enzyme